MKILNKINQLVSKLPAPLAKLFGAKVPKTISWGLIILLGWYPVVAFWFIGSFYFSEYILFPIDFLIWDYPFFTFWHWLAMLGLAYLVLLIWYGLSKNRDANKFLKIALFLLYILFIIVAWYDVHKMNYFQEMDWLAGQEDEELWGWLQNNRELLAIERIETYLGAIYIILVATGLVVVSWLFFGKRNKA